MRPADIPADPDRLTALVEDALRRARCATEVLHDTVLPALAPGDRTGATRLLRALRGNSLFRGETVEEISALLRRLDSRIAAGTRRISEAHEFDPGEFREVVLRDERTEALAQAVGPLTALLHAVTATLDALEARRVVARLWAED